MHITGILLLFQEHDPGRFFKWHCKKNSLQTNSLAASAR